MLQISFFDVRNLFLTWYCQQLCLNDEKNLFGMKTVKNTIVVLDVMFVGQMPMFVIRLRMHLFVLLGVWFLIILLEIKCSTFCFVIFVNNCSRVNSSLEAIYFSLWQKNCFGHDSFNQLTGGLKHCQNLQTLIEILF